MVLVISVSRRLRGGDHSLCGGKDLRPAAVRTQLVRLRLIDCLPYKRPQKPRKEKLSVLRYVMFALSLALVSRLFLIIVAHLEQITFWLFLVGNAFYYIAGILLAFAFKDNRAFCKVSLPHYGISQAFELLFSASRPLR